MGTLGYKALYLFEKSGAERIFLKILENDETLCEGLR
jgi:hypothetical protein